MIYIIGQNTIRSDENKPSWYICKDTEELDPEALDYGYNESIRFYLWPDGKWRKTAWISDNSYAYYETKNDAIEHFEKVTGAKYTSPKRYSLAELLKQVTPESLHGEINTGPPIGVEEW